MSRNVFENNEPISAEEATKFGHKMHSLLPPLPEGKHYEIVTLESGRQAVVLEDGS
jgi:hypothetical protein